jgi:hypothetical protein
MVDNNHSVDAMFLIHVETVAEYFKRVHIDQSAVSPEGVKRCAAPVLLPVCITYRK